MKQRICKWHGCQKPVVDSKSPIAFAKLETHLCKGHVRISRRASFFLLAFEKWTRNIPKVPE